MGCPLKYDDQLLQVQSPGMVDQLSLDWICVHVIGLFFALFVGVDVEIIEARLSETGERAI